MLKEKVQISIYHVKCKLCGKKIEHPNKQECSKLLNQHLENDCPTMKKMKDWRKKGIYKEMMALLREQGLITDLKKILKHYSAKEICKALNVIELGEEIC